MEILLLVLLVLVVVVAVGAVVSYNRFVSQKTLIKDAWANIDTELRRRYDLIPNLVETVKGYASHEKEVLENVTRARAMAAGATGSPAEQAAAEGPLVAALRQLMVVVENYPNLKADQNFLQLQGELTNTEDRLQTARRFYNANVRDYNRRVKQFPSVVVANMFDFEEEEFFEVEDAIREGGAPQVDFGAPIGHGRAACRRAALDADADDVGRDASAAGRRRPRTAGPADPAEPGGLVVRRDRAREAIRRRPTPDLTGQPAPDDRPDDGHRAHEQRGDCGGLRSRPPPRRPPRRRRATA